MFATRKNRRQRGLTLIAVVMFAASVSALCVLTLTSSASQYSQAKSRLEGTKAFYVCEGGIDYVIGQLKTDSWWPARDLTRFPVANADGSFETDWIPLGAHGGEFKVKATYVTENKVPSTWTSPGFPEGFEPFTTSVFASRTTSKPKFDRLLLQLSGRYNDMTRWAKAGVKFKTTIFGSAIVSDAAPVPGTGSGKSYAIDYDTIVLDTNDYVYGGIRANNGVYVGGSSTPLTTANADTLIGEFEGTVMANLYGTASEIPDFTNPGAATQLFEFPRFEAAAAAGGGAVYTSLAQFAQAMRAANAAGTPMEGIIYLKVDAAAEGKNPKLDTGTGVLGIPGGINVKGTLVFDFTNPPDQFYKVFIETPLHINAATYTASFNPADPSTFPTGYPPILSASKDPRNVDISPLGFQNFNTEDDLPALMFDTGTVDIHHETNICGAVYSPAFMEIENKHNARQFFNGTLISGGGVYFEGGSGTTAQQIVKFDNYAVDSLATFEQLARTPLVVAYAVGK